MLIKVDERLDRSLFVGDIRDIITNITNISSTHENAKSLEVLDKPWSDSLTLKRRNIRRSKN